MRRPSAWTLFCGVLLAGYALVLFHHTSFAVGGSDSSGYGNAARLLAQGRAFERIRGLDVLGLGPEFAGVFTPLGYRAGPAPGTMTPSYPPGLSLHMAAAGILAGWARAPFLVSPIGALVCILVVYTLGRELGLPPALALSGSALLGFAPTFVFMAGQSMSDVLATAWTSGAVLAALWSRRRAGWSLLAGLAFGVAVLVRPMDVLVLPALLIAMPLRLKEWLLFALGGLPSAAFLLAYNDAAFGSPWRTGYGGLLKGALAWTHFPSRFGHYAYWLARLFSPLLPVGWLALSADRRVPGRDRAVLLAWFGAFFLFYCFYVTYETWWYTRFLLPGLPAMILGALLVARDFLGLGEDARGVTRRVRWLRSAVASVLVLGGLAVEIQFIGKDRLHKNYKGERVYPDACEMARRRLPPNSIVASMQMSGALHYYTDLTYAMWNWLDPERFALLRASTESRGYRWYALVAPFEQDGVRKALPGEWREIDRVQDVALWELPASWPAAAP
jgi:hypothetical protein